MQCSSQSSEGSGSMYTCKAPADIPQAIEDLSVVSKLAEYVDQAVIFPGNPETEFVAACDKMGGTMKGQRDTHVMGILWHTLTSIQ